MKRDLLRIKINRNKTRCLNQRFSCITRSHYTDQSPLLKTIKIFLTYLVENIDCFSSNRHTYKKNMFSRRNTGWNVPIYSNLKESKSFLLHSYKIIVLAYSCYFCLADENNVYTARFLWFSVYLSNTTSGILCFKYKKYTRATIPNPVYITCRYHGRYVTYYNDRENPP